jgi:hypothetical protein
MFVSDLCYDIADYTVEQRIQDRVDSQGVVFCSKQCNKEGQYGGLSGLLNCPKWSNANNTYYWTIELRETLITQQQNTTDPQTIAALEYNIRVKVIFV